MVYKHTIIKYIFSILGVDILEINFGGSKQCYVDYKLLIQR